MWRERRVAVVIPAFNEERLIGRTVAELPTFVDQVIVVDDASADHTSHRARATGRPGLVIHRHRHNSGVGAATVTGYRLALAQGADLIVGVNGDAQMSPGDLPGVLDALDHGADLVRGNRFARPAALGRMPIERRLATQVLSALTRAATGAVQVTDSQCGYHALTRRALQQLDLDALWPRYGFPNDLVARATEADLRVAEVAVDAVYGDEQSGLRPWHALHPVGTLILQAAWRRARKSSRARAKDLHERLLSASHRQSLRERTPARKTP